MSLQAQLSAFITRVGTEFKAIRTLIGGSGTSDVSALQTAASNLVAAINEVKATADAAAPTDSDDLAEGAANLFYTDERVRDAVAALLVAGNNIALTNDDPGDALTIAYNGPEINDAGSGAGDLWSASQIGTAISAAIDALVDASPGTMDTLNEIAAALGDDPNFSATITGQLAAKANASDVYTQSQLGDPETDLVALFNTAVT